MNIEQQNKSFAVFQGIKQRLKKQIKSPLILIINRDSMGKNVLKIARILFPVKSAIILIYSLHYQCTHHNHPLAR